MAAGLCLQHPQAFALRCRLIGHAFI
jgi:hypothetical protein